LRKQRQRMKSASPTAFALALKITNWIKNDGSAPSSFTRLPENPAHLHRIEWNELLQLHCKWIPATYTKHNDTTRNVQRAALDGASRCIVAMLPARCAYPGWRLQVIKLPEVNKGFMLLPPLGGRGRFRLAQPLQAAGTRLGPEGSPLRGTSACPKPWRAFRRLRHARSCWTCYATFLTRSDLPLPVE
jgi:hypothetical protein